MKRCLVAVLGVAIVVGLASPAEAKGVRDVTIKGPGIPRSMTVDRPTTSALAQASRLYVATSHQPAGVVEDRRPSERLGSRYVATWGWLVAVDTTKPLRQVLYPFAEGGALSYVPPGQRVFDHGPFKGGWIRVGAPLTEVMVALGALPRTAP